MRKSFCIMFIVLLAVSVMTVSVFAESGSHVLKIGQFAGGLPRDVFVTNSYAYVAADGLLSILNISDPSNPVQVGSYDTPGSTRGVYVSGNYAYVADSSSGLRVIDISTPASPSEVGYYDTPGSAVGVFISGNYAYVADGVSGLRVIDISTPSSPSGIGFYNTPGSAQGVYVSGNYAYVADRDSGLRVIDISMPSSPSEIGSYNTPGNAQGIYVNGTYAYVADGSGGLRVINVSTPSSPNIVGYYDTPGDAQGIYVSGTYAYVADYDSGLRVIDISNPASPSEVGFYDTSGRAYGVYVSGTYAYVADRGDGLRVIDISTPSSPSAAGYYNTPGDPQGVYVSGNYAYVADESEGLRAIDISNPASPYEVGSYDTPGRSFGVFVSGNYAYIADYDSGLRVIDISTPSSLSEVGFYNTAGNARSVYISGNYAYVADGGDGLRVIDISTPSSLSEVGFYDTPGYAYGVFVSGNYAYVADYSSGLRVIDISTPSSPSAVGFYDTLGNAQGVYVSGIYAYVADGNRGLRVIDISNPASPSEVGYYNTPGNAQEVYVSGTDAYVADYTTGLRMIDVSTPSSPSEIGYYDTPGNAYDVFVSGNYAYVADGRSGLYIVKHQVPPSNPTWSSISAITTNAFTVSWNDSSDEDNYHYILSNAATGVIVSNLQLAADTTNKAQDGLDINTTYYVKLYASNAIGVSVTIETNITTLPVPPNTPSNVIADTATPTNCIVHWVDTSSGGSQEDNFIVYQNTNAVFSGATVAATTAADVTNTVVNGLDANTTYYFWVMATNTAGSALSSSNSITTSFGPPAAPTVINADNITPNSFRIHWSDNSSGGSAANGFKIYRSTNNNFSTAMLVAYNLPASISNRNINYLATNTRYYIWIEATNANGGSLSASYAVSTLAGTPSAPSSVIADNITSTNCILHWVDNSSSGTQEEAFIVYQNTSNAFATASRIGTTAADVTNLSVSSLTSNTRYYFWVEATNADARSHSAVISIRTLPGAPSAPSNVIANTVTSTNCVLHWVDMSSGTHQEDNFIVYQNTASNFSAASAVATLAADSTSYTARGLSAHTTYYFWVMATNISGSAVSSFASIATSNAIADDITNAGSTKETIVGPNPGKNGESMTFGLLPKNVRIEIYDAIGNQVNNIDVPANQPSYVWTLKNSDDETIAPGIYFARIINIDDESDYKIIKLAVVR